MFHREYKKNGNIHLAYSWILCAQVERWKPMHGETAVQFLNVHFHHLAATKDPAPPLPTCVDKHIQIAHTQDN